MRRWWRLVCCRVRRHRPLLHVATGRIWLRCVECGYETPGWSLRLAPPPASATVRRLKRMGA